MGRCGPDLSASECGPVASNKPLGSIKVEQVIDSQGGLCPKELFKGFGW
jgi:hypothetical protein